MSTTRRGTPEITAEQWGIFLTHLAQTGNVSHSSKMAGICCTKSVYNKKAADEEFAERFKQARQDAVDVLRYAAYQRSVEGVPEPIVSMGKVVMVPDETGRTVPLTVRRYSDAILVALLKAHDDDFRKGNLPPQREAPAIPAELQADPVPEPDEPGPGKPVL